MASLRQQSYLSLKGGNYHFPMRWKRSELVQKQVEQTIDNSDWWIHAICTAGTEFLASFGQKLQCHDELPKSKV